MGPDSASTIKEVSQAVHRLANQIEPGCAWCLVIAKGEKLQVTGCVEPLENMGLFLQEAAKLLMENPNPQVRIPKPTDN